ncbi:iron ABC transporter permease [Selenomonas artemidis]|uniref:FecCD family ABC transporter permease n=1 Tax=Selenomonas artemidis TaxID=671224 RepID=UPI0028D5E24C|nr:iron ABC transporter permease [Selenomonas artemidis]
MPRKFSLRALAPVMGVLLILVSLFSLSWGQFDISFVQVLASLAHAAGLPVLKDVAVTPEQEAVLWHIRFPRTFVGLMVGASLGASGTVMQGIFSNPLADPGIIGVSSGAAVGAVIAISLGLSEESMFFLPMFAFLGSLAAVSLTVMLSMRHGKIPVMMLLLAGVVVGMLLGAITAGILTVISEQKMQQYLFWTIGSLDYRRWEHVLLGVGPICIGLAVMLFMARHLNILVLGDVEARAVGMPVTRYRLILLAVASMTTATGVCISGNIGFVGLIVPHMMRMIVGPDHRRLLPASILAGGMLLVFCDTLGRIVLDPIEIRVGIMTALLGTPYFLYLLRKNRRILS